jgi:hypothetical protein
MMSNMTRRAIAACAAGLCALVAAGSAAAAARQAPPALTPAGHDALSRALAHGRLTEAEYALERARSLFDLAGARREFGDVDRPSPHSATLLLRDLVARFQALSPADRATARGILARPTTPVGDPTYNPTEHHYRTGAIVATACLTTHPLCFHWDERARDRDSPPGADGDTSTVPPDVQATIDTFADVYDLEVGTYGFLAPLPDTASRRNEGDGRTDIYLADVGGDQVPLFGYCTSDDPHAFDSGYPYYDVSAYCVVDEDFAPAQFGSSQTPQGFRAVTAAHEFFHAIQFHYDWFEDLWLLEGTAMFMEDQFADGVNDNVSYLDRSAIVGPGTPVDYGSQGFEYGAWVWWRFLVEDLGELGNPLVIKQVWEGVAGASTDTDGAGPDTVSSNPYSLSGVQNVLGARGLAAGAVFAKFARMNKIPYTFYEEGTTYPRATVRRRFSLAGRGSGVGPTSVRLLHLSSTYASFKPGAATRRNAVLRVRVDLPDSRYAPKASLLIREVGQPWRVREFALDALGKGGRTVPFGRGETKEIVLVLTNASTRMRCERRTSYSCTGVGADDGRRYTYRAVVR